LQKVLDTIHVTGEHYVFETGRPLPKKTINNFKKSRGLTIKIGDKSHPKAVEVISSVPDWAEKFDRFVDRLSDFFDLSAPSKDSKKKPDPDYVRRRLGHKSLQSTQIYINMEQALFSNSSNEYHVKIAQSVEQAMALIEVGFEYVTGEYNDGGKIFKKRK
jgi:hypothetical protein